MKKLLALLACIPALAVSQVTPNIPAGTIMGNGGASAAAPGPISALPPTVSISLGSIPPSGTRSNSTTSLALVSTDNGNIVTQCNASASAATLPQIGTNSIAAGYWAILLNQCAGTITLTPTTSTISSATVVNGASINIAAGAGCLIVADNSASPGNYNAWCTAPAVIPASSITGGTMSGATALINGAVIQATGFSPTASTCPAGADRFNIPGTHQPGVCVNGNNVGNFDSDSGWHSLVAAPTIAAVSGCTVVSAATGDALGFEFTLTTTTGVCVFSVTQANASKGANARWVCNGTDVGQGTTIFQTGLTSSTVSTFKTGTGTVNGDVVVMQCKPI